MRVSSIRQGTTNDSYAYAPRGFWAHPRDPPQPQPPSFERAPVIFWPVANTDAANESVVLRGGSCFRECRPARGKIVSTEENFVELRARSGRNQLLGVLLESLQGNFMLCIKED